MTNWSGYLSAKLSAFEVRAARGGPEVNVRSLRPSFEKGGASSGARLRDHHVGPGFVGGWLSKSGPHPTTQTREKHPPMKPD